MSLVIGYISTYTGHILTACLDGGYGPGYAMRPEMKSGISSSPVIGTEKMHPNLGTLEL